MTQPRLVLVGEAMLELSHPEGQAARLSYGGDVLNTSVYLARFGHNPYFVSALGTDPYSENLIKTWQTECVQTSYILRDPSRMPGLYAIQTDHMGERSFFYWRSNSAARNFFNLPGADKALDFAAGADWLFLSGITLSIFNAEERQRLCALARAVREAGGQVVFDPNYRPAGWDSGEEAAQSITAFGSEASILLATIDDENLLHGQMPGDAHSKRWHDLGVDNVILKCGAKGAVISRQGETSRVVPEEVCERPIDTTGAGDSFNAAFIAAACRGLSLELSCAAGNRLAGQVIQHPGAIMPVSAMPDIKDFES